MGYHLEGWFKQIPILGAYFSCGHYSSAIGGVGLKTGPEKTSVSWGCSCVSSAIGEGLDWIQALHPRLLQWHPSDRGEMLHWPGDRAPWLFRQEPRVSFMPVLYNSVNDRETKLIGNPNPLFLAQKYVFRMEILTEC